MPAVQNYCAPDKEAQLSFRQSKTCFTLSSLQKLARAWNAKYGAPEISGISKKSKMALWADLNARMNARCRGMGSLGKEGCWIDQLKMSEDSEPFQDMRYPKPENWYQAPRTWLTNFEIEDVMEQYDHEPSFEYHFLGVYPMDFADIYGEMREMSWDHLTQRGTAKCLGMITNLDDHDEPGSHWTSLFAVLDPKKPSFGVYYYDSVSSPPTFEIKRFMVRLMLRALANALKKTVDESEWSQFPFKKYNRTEIQQFTRWLATRLRDIPGGIKSVLPHPFQMKFNTHQHQYKNTECGIFSMVYQIRWLEALQRNPRVTFEHVVQHRMKDDEIHRFRDVLFRPNSGVKVKNA